MRVYFEMSFDVDVPEDIGKPLASLVETFINDVCRLIPTPKIRAGVGEISPERNDDKT